jgi:hypothetical protein
LEDLAKSRWFGRKFKMAKPKNTDKQNTALVVNADSKQVIKLRQDLPNWLWIEAPNGWPFDKGEKSIAQSFEAIIVSASRGTEARALAICKYICEKQLLSELPLLIAGSRYLMPLAHAVKRLPRGGFIFTPIEEETLLNEIEKSRVRQL